MEHLGHVFFLFRDVFFSGASNCFWIPKNNPGSEKRPEVLIQLKRFSWATFALRERREKSGNVSPSFFAAQTKSYIDFVEEMRIWCAVWGACVLSINL